MVENTRSGLIPYLIKDDQVYVCLMLPSNSEFGGKCFQFAKGHREKNETERDCAIREAIEELGLKPNKINSPWHVNDLKKISWWAAEYNTFDLDKHSNESKDVKWFALPDAFIDIRDWQRAILGKFVYKLRERYPNQKFN